jgi:hypothetical protein
MYFVPYLADFIVNFIVRINISLSWYNGLALIFVGLIVEDTAQRDISLARQGSFCLTQHRFLVNV